MSSSTTSHTVNSVNSGGKAAVIRPVNRGDGKQSFVRIDVPAATPGTPNLRALQLEDYVAQIRDQKPEAGQVSTTESSTATTGPLDLIREVSQKQQLTTRELTETEHLDVLRTVHSLDRGQQWIDEQNRAAAMEAMEKRRQISSSHRSEKEPNNIPGIVSPELISSIATAIASVLTDRSEKELEHKVQGSNVDSTEETLRLSPELPRPGYTLPVTEQPAAEPEAVPSTHVDAPLASKTVSVTAAAWEVPSFRWPVVTDSILSHGTLLSRLASSCSEMLAPFGKTIAITSPKRGQGTSTMAMTLARLFASKGSQVLLVDADITNPNLSRSIGLESVGWFESDSVVDPIGESIVHGKDSGVCVMPLREKVTSLSASSAPLFDQLESCIDQVRSEFDLVLIDAGPVWQIVDEISSSSQLIDAAMLVNQDTHSHGFSEARQRLMDRGVFKFIAAQNSFAKRAG